jgi:hypothetical protein
VEKKIKFIYLGTLVCLFLTVVYSIFSPSFEAAMATNQLEDSRVLYSVSQIAANGALIKAMWILWIVIVSATVLLTMEKEL